MRKVILCSGKHYYTLAEEREKRQAYDTAILRLESLCPFPIQELQAQLAQYGNVQCESIVNLGHKVDRICTCYRFYTRKNITNIFLDIYIV